MIDILLLNRDNYIHDNKIINSLTANQDLNNQIIITKEIKRQNNEIRSYISYTIANNYIEYCIVSIIQYKMGQLMKYL